MTNEGGTSIPLPVPPADVAVAIPVLDRPRRVEPLLASLIASQRHLELRPYFILSPGDLAELEAILWTGSPYLITGFPPGPGDFARKTNMCFQQTSEQWFFAGADDLHFHPGWADEAVRVAVETGAGMVGTNDLGNSRVVAGLHATHSMFRRSYVEECGTIDAPGHVYCELYDHQFCNPPEAPVLMGDLSFEEIGQIKAGDDVIGWEYVSAGASQLRKLRRARVSNVHRSQGELVEVVLASGRSFVCTSDHRWLNAAWSPASAHGAQWVSPKEKRTLARVIDPIFGPPSRDERLAGWLGGIYDGEGTHAQIGQAEAVNPDVYGEICRALSHFGFAFKATEDRVWINGGWRELVRFLNIARPIKRTRAVDRVLGSDDSPIAKGRPRGGTRFALRDRVIEVRPNGQGEVVSLSTETGNYIAWGYASHNCDVEAYETAIDRGCFAFANAAVVEHLHPLWGKGETDATYEKGQAKGASDRALYQRRRSLWT